MKSKKHWNPRNLIFFLSVLLITVAAIHLFSSQSPMDAAAEKVYKSVIVHEGDNLWSLATKYMPNEDPRTVIREIVQVNGLKGSSISPGQAVDIPVSP